MNLSAIIIGGGPGGLSAAIALRQIGVRVKIFEQAKEFSEGGAALSFAPNAMYCLDHFGVGDDFRKNGTFIKKFGFKTFQNKTLVDFDLEACLKEYADERPYVVIGRSQSHSLLLNKVPDCCVFDKRLAKYEQKDGKVTAYFQDGTTETADILIGADGIHSVVCQQMFGEQASTKYVGYTVRRAIVKDFHIDGADYGHLVVSGPSLSKGCRLFFADMGNNSYYWFWATLENEGEKDASGEEAQETIVKHMRSCGWHENFINMIEKTDPKTIDRRDIYVRDPLPYWSQGHVTMIGDACHPMTPEVGQGAAMAIEDAKCLADCLKNCSNIKKALETYQTKRIPRTTQVAARASRNGFLLSFQNPILCYLREKIVSLIGSKMIGAQTFIWEHKA